MLSLCLEIGIFQKKKNFWEKNLFLTSIATFVSHTYFKQRNIHNWFVGTF